MTRLFNPKDIKNKTRIALPDDDKYLLQLGIALYGFNSINSFVVEVICHIDKSKKHSELISKETGKIIDFFLKMKDEENYKSFPLIHLDMEKAIGMFSILKDERNDFVHSYPITNKKGEQILHRRLDRDEKYFEVNNLFLQDFITRLEKVSDLLYIVRSVVRPDLS